MTETTTQDPAAIERDIRQTQDEMSRTVDRIGDQLNFRTLVNALLDKADSNQIDARGTLEYARRNPLALAMIAGGTIWLISDSDAKLPSMPAMPSLPSFGFGSDEPDPDHRDYVAHMQGVEWRDGEDPATYQRRRDTARANYFMIERDHEEDESSFRQRLNDAAEAFRSRRRAWAEQGRHAGEAVSAQGQAALTSAQDVFADNPLVGGLVAAAVGALVGTLVPISETEQEQLSGLGEKARELADEQKDKLTEIVREKKDELVAKAEDTVKPAQQQPPAPAPSQSAAPQSPQSQRPQAALDQSETLAANVAVPVSY
jgi:ElaB/YqjD/DUF883 family membrane-anchored ribosome-binding protein